jgi:hypothetical protein
MATTHNHCPHCEATIEAQAQQIQTLTRHIEAANNRIAALCDAHEEQFIAREHAEAERDTLRQQLAETTQEAADWRLSFETSNDHVGQLQAQLAEAQQTIADVPDVVRGLFRAWAVDVVEGGFPHPEGERFNRMIEAAYQPQLAALQGVPDPVTVKNEE